MQMEWGFAMTYLIYARDGTSQIVLKRDSDEAARKKAHELREMGWFDVEIRQPDARGEKPAT
jgi:hypothetical protein